MFELDLSFYNWELFTDYILKGFEIAGKNYGRPIETYILAAITYFVICFSLSKAVRKIQAKVAIIRSTFLSH